MGITISHRLKLNKVYVKDALDRAEELANTMKTEQADKMDIAFIITRKSDYCLFVDIDGCETLDFDFKSKQELEEEAKGGWSYLHATLTEDGKKELDNGYQIEKYPENEIYFASSFCKTQYSKSILGHYWVAELIRKVAGYCTEVRVSDEGDYYHSGNLKHASEAIENLGKMIGDLGSTLANAFGQENIIVGGKTNIKSSKRK